MFRIPSKPKFLLPSNKPFSLTQFSPKDMRKYLFTAICLLFLSQAGQAQYQLHVFGPRAKMVTDLGSIPVVAMPEVDARAERRLDQELAEKAKLTKSTPPFSE
jgi:hypothetical protein